MSLIRGPRQPDGQLGDVSSKRAFGVFCALVAGGLAFLYPEAWQGYTAFLTAATGVFVAQAATNT